ncbi:hypothetical protein HDV03_000707 [Kappamyces sp. JEL0829]|nr:hypothetical protein HDV03_000707 [Kappamyces sp. JEL0829]
MSTLKNRYSLASVAGGSSLDVPRTSTTLSRGATTSRPMIRTFRKSSILERRVSLIQSKEALNENLLDFNQQVLSPRISLNSLKSLQRTLSSRNPTVTSPSLAPAPDVVIRKEQGSVFIGALQALESRLLSPMAGSSALTGEKNTSDLVPPAPLPPAILYQNQPQIDYTTLFPSDVGVDTGCTIFRIEMLLPVPLDPQRHGSFCVADAYIVLISTPKDTDKPESELTHQVYTWIGVDAETDKRFCCAMYAVALRNVVGSTERILRQCQGEESNDFLEQFSGKIELLDHSFATETGLYMPEERRYPTKLYRVDGKSQLPLFLVELKRETLDPRNVYILDAGREIYQWNGKDSSLQSKSKARMIASRINKEERVGKAEYVEQEQGQENERFCEILDSLDVSVDEDEPRADHLQFVDLYRVFPKIAPELESHIVATGKLKKSLLVTDGIYILDVGTEISLWVGKEAWSELRAISTELFTTSKVPYSNFKLTTQKEMEDLVRSMYKCPVQVKLVEYGMEPFALLAHLENSYILHHGSRSEFLGRQKPKVAAQPSLYQIRTDERFETTRTMQVDFDSPLISRDCFFFFDQALENHLLWRGENFDLSLLELAVEAVIKITQCALFRADSVSESLHSNVIKEANEEEEEEDIPTTLPENVQFASGLDSPALATFYGNLDSNIPFLSIPDSMPKLFTCSCASGYFRVERLAHYSQSHLQPDTCVLIDPGSDQSLFVWMGRDASDVVKKLGMQCAHIWLQNCQDGRYFGPSLKAQHEFVIIETMVSQPMARGDGGSKLQVVNQGYEPAIFKAFFQGWDEKRFQVVEPGNLFSREHGTLATPMLFHS